MTKYSLLPHRLRQRVILQIDLDELSGLLYHAHAFHTRTAGYELIRHGK